MENVAYKSTKILSKMFFGLLIAQFFSRLCRSLGHTIDGIIVGNFLDANSLIALGLIKPVCSIVDAVADFVSGGSQIVYGKLMGRGEHQKMDGVFTVSITMLVVIGLIITAIFIIFAEKIVVLLGATGSAIATTKDYLTAIAIGVVPMMLIPVLSIYLHLENDSKFVVLTTVLLTLFSSVFSIVNICIFHKGIFGVGVANTVARYLVLIILTIHFIKSDTLMKLDFKQFDFKYIGEIIYLGLPAALSSSLFSLRAISINKLASYVGGNNLLSSIAILNSVEGLIFSQCATISHVVIMMFSLFVGERDFDTLTNFCKFLVKIFLVLGAINIIVFVLLAKPFASAFGAKGVIYDMTVEFIKIFTLASLPSLYVVMFSSLNQAFGRVRLVNIANVLNCLIFPIGFILATNGFIGNYAVYFNYLFAETMTTVFYIVYSWFANKKVSFKIKDLINIPKDMEPEYKETWSIGNNEDVSLASKEIMAFCQKSGIDKKSSMYCGICLEEMAVNILENGFKDAGDVDKAIDVFAIYENNNLIVRLRDNAPHFDPKTRLPEYDPENPIKYIGVYVVRKLAKEIDYQSTFGTNVFTFKL